MPTQFHDRQVDGLPADPRHARIGKVLPFDVSGSIQVRVDLESAGQAQENRLGQPVAPMHEPAPGTPLAGLSRIDGKDGGANFLGLVGREGPKLGVAPTMMPSPLLAATLLGAGTNAREVLEDDYAARFHALDDALAQNVVAILPKPCLTPGDLLEMPLGASAAFGLELATKAEVPLFNLLPAPLSQELPVGQDGGSVDAEIDADDLAGRQYLRRVDGDDDVEPPTGRTAHKVGVVEAGRPVEPALGVVVDAEWELDPASHGGQADDTLVHFHAVGSRIIPDGPAISSGCADLPALLRQDEGGLDGFSRLHPRRDHQLTWQGWMLGPKVVVGRLVQRDTVPDTVFPTVFSNRVEANARSGKRSFQDRIPVFGHLKLETDRALHGSYVGSFLLMFKLCSARFPHFLCRLKSAVSMRGFR